MNIVLYTCHSCNNSSISGIARYSLCLYEKLQSSVFPEPVLCVETPLAPSWLVCIGKYFGKDIETVQRYTPLTFPQYDNKHILHCTSQTLAFPLLYTKRKCIVTVHDIIPYATKTYATAGENLIYPFLLKALKKATHIIADSEHTKKDIMHYIQYPENKITVIPLGVNHKEFFVDKHVKRKSNVILYVGSEAKRKNLIILLKALALVVHRIPDVQFIKIGQAQDNVMRQELQKTASLLDITNHIIWKDYVENLREEYNQATLFVFPSLYEGFGFPLLEAMACGCPVITSDKTSLPEIAGNAALYFDGMDEKDLAEKIISVLKNKPMQQKMQKRGVAQAKKFTWEKCAEETINIYEHVSAL